MTKVQSGPVAREAEAFDNFITGTIGVAFPAVAIFQEQRQILEVLVQNDPDSASDIFVGNITGQYIQLSAGQSITIPVNDLNKVYAGTAGGAATVNWIAMV